MRATWLLCVLMLGVIFVSQMSDCMKVKVKKRKHRVTNKKWTLVKEMHQNISQLFHKIEELSNPVRIHVHGMDYVIDREGQARPAHHSHHPRKSTMMGAESEMEDKKEGRHEKIFEETHDHKHEDPRERKSDNDAKDGSGTHVHLHFNIPSYPTMPENGMTGGDYSRADVYTYAKCQMTQDKSDGPHRVKGYVGLRQKPNHPLEIAVNLTGLNVPHGRRHKATHGFHIHEYGNLQDGCRSFGGHFNPKGHTHGGPHDSTRHVGDLGNLEPNQWGHILEKMKDEHSSLFGEHSIIGRGIVLHEGTDDLGKGGTKASQSTGDAGGRLACCIIARSQPLSP